MKFIQLTGLLTILTFAYACSGTEQTGLKVMSFNIRYDEPDDSIQNWNFRKDNAAKVICFHDVDIVGMQEVLHNQVADLKQRLPQYDCVGVAREDGKQDGEYSPVFYHKDKYSLVDGGTFWMSETPDKPSIGWDAACKRITTWVILKDLNSNKEIAVFNTHFDHVGVKARQESASLLVQKAQELAGGRPVVITGDFNGTADSEAIKRITGHEGTLKLRNGSESAQMTYGPDWTYHGFGRVPLQKRRTIDYVFVNRDFQVLKYGVLNEDINGVYLSDHCPVLLQLLME